MTSKLLDSEEYIVKETQQQAYLYCKYCRDDVLHVITYLNVSISSIECKNCGRQMNSNINISHELRNELVERISRKPSKMKEEFQVDMIKFILSLPLRLVSKPIRIIKETKSLKSYIKKNNRL